MAQVIIVSNRLPVSVSKEDGKLVFSPSLGGLATGLSSYANDRRNQWIGWPGIPSDELTDKDKEIIALELGKRHCTPVFLSKKQIDEFYNGFSNEILWPLFHGLPIRAKSSAQQQAWWRTYREVNKLYSQAVVGQARQDSQIWVHDYQLLLLPEMLRSEGAGRQIGFFLHITFPAVTQFTKLKQYKKLLRGMTGADLIGFHTTGYMHNFLETCQAAHIGQVTDKQLGLDGRTVRVGDFPMGIDYAKYAGARKQKDVRAAVKRYRKRYGRRKIIVAVDRLDPTKGLAERLRAYRLFLERNPRLHGKVIFAMVAAPSRTDIAAYKSLAKRLNSLVKEINTAYGTKSWQPVDYMNVSQPFEEVTALFQIADVGFIAPLRDGMNLAAKEFVAANRRRGVLILSETAGAAEELGEALIVDPKSPDAVVEALEKAFRMRKHELRQRLKSMQRHLSSHTVQAWAQTFVTALQQPVPGAPHLTRTLNPRLQKDLQAEFRRSGKRLLLLDYDGSLVPFSLDYADAQPPKSLLSLLDGLSQNPLNDTVLISGRSADDLGRWFSEVPISLVAEHGAALKKAGNKTWRIIERPDTAWKQLLTPALERYVRLAPGARLEVKPHSLVWHYRNVSPYYAQKYSVTIKRVLKPILKRHGLELLQGNKILEIKNPHVNKGAAAQEWLKRSYDFILAIGDDATDEELFAALPVNACSIKVGRGRTAARFRVASHRDIVALLKKLSKA